MVARCVMHVYTLRSQFSFSDEDLCIVVKVICVRC
jgi:hypothetical protein